MKSNNSKIRVRGQRMIPTAFINRKSTNDDELSDCGKKVENGTTSKKRTKISLSDFLERKLQKASKPSNLVKGKDRQFLSPGTSISVNQTIDGANTGQKNKEPVLNGILDVLKQFKPSKENEDNISFIPEDETQSSCVTQLTEESKIQDLSQRRNTFGGLHGKPPAPKRLVVLGDDPKPRQTICNKLFIRKEKPLPLYNHYASGSGWWDSDMEGIDNEAVGFNEVWEGVGSATMGGLDWH